MRIVLLIFRESLFAVVHMRLRHEAAKRRGICSSVMNADGILRLYRHPPQLSVILASNLTKEAIENSF